MAEELDVEAMLEAPFQKQKEVCNLCITFSYFQFQYLAFAFQTLYCFSFEKAWGMFYDKNYLLL